MFNPKDKELLTFDCYGTLIDWESGILAALKPVLSSHGVKMDDERCLEDYAQFESAAESGAYLPYRQVLAECLKGFGERYGFTPNPEELKRFSESVGDWEAFPDTSAALQELKKHYKLAILSNIDDDLFAPSNRRLGVQFDYIVTAQQVRSYKPAYGHFEAILRRSGLPKERILHVAQSLFHDHVPAKQLGFDTAWVNRRKYKTGTGATPFAEAQPDLEVPDLKSLADVLC